MEFSKYIKQEYFKWEQEQGEPCTVTDFARWLGVSQQSMSAWMKGLYNPRKLEDIAKLKNKLGPEVFNVLGLGLPAELDEPIEDLARAIMEFPPEVRGLVRATIIETAMEAAQQKQLKNSDWVTRRMMELLLEKVKKQEATDSV